MAVVSKYSEVLHDSANSLVVAIVSPPPTAPKARTPRRAASGVSEFQVVSRPAKTLQSANPTMTMGCEGPEASGERREARESQYVLQPPRIEMTYSRADAL